MKQMILMSAENPNGAKLEEHLEQMIEEVVAKTNKIATKDSVVAQLVTRNNMAIMEHLAAARALQVASNAVLDQVGKNQGPTGTPRI